MKEEMSPFFSAVAELAGSRGFEVADVNEGALTLNLNGEFAAMVDETGAMNYYPYKEVFDMMDEYVVLLICARIDRKTVPENLEIPMAEGGRYYPREDMNYLGEQFTVEEYMQMDMQQTGIREENGQDFMKYDK